MSTLVVRNKSRLDNLRMKLQEQRGSGINNDPSRIVLADMSGSMWAVDAMSASGNRISRIEALSQILESDFPDAKVLYFSTSSEIGLGKKARSYISLMGGGTDLTSAVKLAKLRGHKSLILITDGHPDNADSALLELRGVPTHAIYVGPEPKPSFFARLERQQKAEGLVTIHKTLDWKDPSKISAAIKGLLT